MGNIARRTPTNDVDESGGFITTDRGKVAAATWASEPKGDKDVETRMHALELGGQTHDTCDELSGAPTERAGYREQDTNIQRETRNTREILSKR